MRIGSFTTKPEASKSIWPLSVIVSSSVIACVLLTSLTLLPIHSLLLPTPFHINCSVSALQTSHLRSSAAMATVLVPRFSALPSSPAFSPIAAASARVGLPHYRGLKVGSALRTRPIGSRSHGPTYGVARRRGGVVVCEAQDTAVEVPAVTDATWQSLVLECELPVLVEFWAPWCGPCRMIHPIIDELAKQYAGKLKCYKVNTDEGASIATKYGIRSIPTVIIFKGGEKKDAVIGAVPKSTLTTSIEKFL